MPRFLKEVKKDKELSLKSTFQVREDFISPWQSNLINKQDIQPDIERDISPDIEQDSVQVASRYIPDSHKIATRNIPDSSPDTNQIATRELTRYTPGIHPDIKPDIKRDICLLRHYVRGLIGHQKKMFEYVLDFANLNDGFNSGFISSHEMASAIGCTYPTVKITLFKMVEKGIFIRHKGKGCRGGYIILEIPKIVKGFYLEQNQDIKRDSKRDIQQDNSNIHYNNSNKNIITIGEGWDEVDFSSLEPIGFRKNHLLQIKKFTTPEITQESVNHFAFALENNEKVRKYETPLNVLITVLKRGEAWVEGNYESPLERAQRLQLERRRAEQNRVQKREEELRNLEFNEWEKNLDEDQKRKISPRGFVGDMKNHFYENVWPEIKKNLEKQ